MFPSKDRAFEILSEAVVINPGRWEAHSINVARAAELIARKIDGMDSDKSFVLGLLHDIGRRNGFSYIKHVVDGINYMEGLGFSDVARICLTHSFVIKNVATYVGEMDIREQELNTLTDMLDLVEYDDYDRLIQLCDSIADHQGFCRLEIRFVDVAIRYGYNEYTIEKWKKTMELKSYFDSLCNKDVYEILNVK